MFVSDLVGRRLFAPTQLPVGIITSIVGAPYLLWLLARRAGSWRGGQGLIVRSRTHDVPEASDHAPDDHDPSDRMG